MTQSIKPFDITPITISNNLFMCGTKQWAPKGICYQPTDFVDPISDDNITTITSLLDPSNAYGFVSMNINAIRVYQVDPTKSHMLVMNALAKAGIYVLVGAVDHTTVLDGATIYNAKLKTVADEFCQFQNVLGFSIGNETINPNGGTTPGYDIPTKIKAGAKYLKTYMAANSVRTVPVTAALRDAPEYTIPAAKAYMCGDASERLDFLGYNCERWAGGSLAAKVGSYYKLVKAFEGANPVPITFTEMGSNPASVSPRTWEQTDYLYGGTDLTPQSGSGAAINMADVVSGGFAFRYYERNAGWGMINKTTGAEIPNHGANSLITQYAAITDFSSTGNTLGKVSCDPNNPYVAGAVVPSSGLPSDVSVTLTNGITNPSSGRNIKFNYTSNVNSANPTWIEAVAIAAKGADTTFTFPKGTDGISMIYEVNATWNQGCQLKGQALLKLKEGDTLSGDWISGGNGNCPIS